MKQKKPFPGLLPKQKATLEETIEIAGKWLGRFGFTLTVITEKDDTRGKKLGEYESGSVFSKNIEITLYPASIREYAKSTTKWQKENDMRYARWRRIGTDYEDYVELQITLTVWHETGHALIEQIVDWMENIPEIEKIIDDEFEKKYTAVIDDDYAEEELVEDFAWNMTRKKTDILAQCFEELDRKLTGK